MFSFATCADAFKKVLASRAVRAGAGIIFAAAIALSVASQFGFFPEDAASLVGAPEAKAALCASNDYNCIYCQGVTCSSYCSGTRYYYNGSCSFGDCFYSSSITAGTCGAVCTPGTTRTRYATSYTSCGAYCISQVQTCNSTGTGWSGTYTQTSCSPSSRTAYSARTSACGTWGYLSETQYCQSGGSWSGSYTLTSPPSITSRTRYAAATSACGTYGSNSETQYCQSTGSFSGSYSLTSPATITTRTRYAALTSACGTYGSTSETQSCLAGGSFSGSYTLTSPPSASSRTRYASSSACSSCSSQTQYCQSNGTWSGTYAYSSCSVISPSTYYEDLDGDGYGTGSGEGAACTLPGGASWNNSDCNDNNASVWRILNPAYIDNDGDGYSNGQTSICYGSSIPSGYRSSTSGGDCNDANPTVYRWLSGYTDADGDGYGTGSVNNYICSGSSLPSGYASVGGDCDDGNASVYPGTTRTRYQSSSVSCGSSCAAETQTCSGGSWTPNNYSYTSCTVSSCTPAAPSGLSIDAATSQTQVTLRWTDNSSNESEFRIYRDSVHVATVGANTTSYTNTGLTCNTSYTYYVRSYSEAGGLSSASNSASRTTLPCTPATPSNVYIYTYPTQLDISWNDNSNNESYFAIYLNGSSIGTVGANVTSFSHTGLTCSTSYGNYTVRACNAVYCSGDSIDALGRTSLCTPSPSSPPNGTWTSSRNFCASVTGYPGNSTRARFVIGGTTYNGNYVSGSGSSCYTHTSDLNGTTWYAYTEDSSGVTSGNSSSLTARVDTTAPTPNPPTVTTGTITLTTAAITISSGSDAGSGLNSSAYGISVNGGSYTWYSSASNIVTGLTCDTSYTVYGRIRDALGNLTSAGSTSFSTQECPPPAPTGVSATFSYGGTPTLERVDISWNAVSGATSYTIYEKVNGGSWQTISPDYSWGATSKSVRNGTLSCGSTYEYAVVANGPTGSSVMSSSSGVLTYTTPGSLPNFAIYANSPTSMWLSTWWGGSYLPSGGPAPLYNIRRNGALIATIPQYDLVDSGLNQNTSYSYSIQPTNACGGGPTSPSYSGRTLGSMSMYQGGSTQTSISACWSDPVNPSHPDIDTYNYRNIIRNSGAASYSSPVGSTSGCWSDTGLSCGTGYTYIAQSGLTVKNNGNGTGLASAAVNSPTYTFYTDQCDSTPPTFSISGPSTAWTTSASVTATASDPAGVSYVRHCWADTGVMPPCEPGTSSSNTFTNGSSVSQTTTGSSWYVCFRARDAYGNWTPAITSGNYASYCWGPVRVDTTAPTPNPPTPSESSTSASSISVTLSGSDAHSGMNSSPYSYKIGAGSWSSWTSSGSYTFNGLSCETPYTVYGKLRDTLGNETSGGSRNITTGSCVVPPSTVSTVSASETSGGGAISVSWTNVGANGYRVYLRGGRSNPNSTIFVQDTGSASISSYSNVDCPGSYSVIVVPYNSDPTVGTDSSCSNAFASNGLLSGMSVPTGRKCGTPTTGTVNVTSCTRGFLFE